MGLTLAFVSRAASASAAIALCMAMGIRMSLISTRATLTPHCSVALSRVALGTNNTPGRAQCWQRENHVVYPAGTEGQGKPAQQKEMLQGHQHPAWGVHSGYHSIIKHLLVNTSVSCVASLLLPKL